MCPAEKSCAANGNTSNCSSPAQSSLGDTTCQAKDTAYVSTNNKYLDRAACTNDQFDDSNTCKNCPKDYSCDLQAGTKTPCPSGTYSKAGETYCSYIPVGSTWNAGTGQTVSCTSDQYFDYATNTCKTASKDPKCQAGWYYKVVSTTHSCETCQAGKYCLDGALNAQTTTSTNYYSEANWPDQIPCPAGHKCTSKTSAAACST